MDNRVQDSNPGPGAVWQHGSRTNMEAPLVPERAATRVPKPYNRGVQFEYNQTDFNVAEFYEEFHDYLPKTVIVNQGFCGEIIEDIFDRGQVIRIHAISKQRRVVARLQYVSHSMLISIPETYDQKLCILNKNKKRGKPKQIYTILKENTLPLTVQFPKDQTITVGNQTINTNNIPSLQLIQQFDEVYLLGNFINDGKMNSEVIPVPLYLSQLRMSIVTGIKDLSDEKWTNYQLTLDHEASGIEFDLEFGNPNIAEYDRNAVHSQGIYTYVEPREYSNIVKLVHKAPECLIDISDEQNDGEDPGMYEEIENTARDGNAKRPSERKQPQEQPMLKTELEAPSSSALKPDIFTESAKEMRPNTTSFKPQLLKSGGPSPIALKPIMQSSTLAPKQPPPIPERKLVPVQNKPILTPGQSLYSNVLPRSQISPTVHIAQQQISPTVHIAQQQISSTVHIAQQIEQKRKQNITETSTPDVDSCKDVTKLTIDEVSVYMRKLKLEKYVDDFKSQLIDGRMLVGLDKDMLKEEFGVKGVEALRLINFAKDGHVPK